MLWWTWSIPVLPSKPGNRVTQRELQASFFLENGKAVSFDIFKERTAIRARRRDVAGLRAIFVPFYFEKRREQSWQSRKKSEKS